MDAVVRQAIVDAFDAAQTAPNGDYSTRITWNGKVYKVRVELPNPDHPKEIIIRIKDKSPTAGQVKQ